LEELVGEIQDESDEELPAVEKISVASTTAMPVVPDTMRVSLLAIDRLRNLTARLALPVAAAGC
ncbi:MAG TPA: hypothetical protein PLL04_07890, partial [Thauera sp.]|nr:hypothetical protein [Thauera sp.]